MFQKIQGHLPGPSKVATTGHTRVSALERVTIQIRHMKKTVVSYLYD